MRAASPAAVTAAGMSTSRRRTRLNRSLRPIAATARGSSRATARDNRLTRASPGPPPRPGARRVSPDAGRRRSSDRRTRRRLRQQQPGVPQAFAVDGQWTQHGHARFERVRARTVSQLRVGRELFPDHVEWSSAGRVRPGHDADIAHVRPRSARFRCISRRGCAFHRRQWSPRRPTHTCRMPTGAVPADARRVRAHARPPTIGHRPPIVIRAATEISRFVPSRTITLAPHTRCRLSMNPPSRFARSGRLESAPAPMACDSSQASRSRRSIARPTTSPPYRASTRACGPVTSMPESGRAESSGPPARGSDAAAPRRRD